MLEPGAHEQSALVSPVRDQLAMLFALSGVVLLLCCANVAGLTLVRVSARTGEMAVRVSIGATRARVVSLLATESLLLAMARRRSELAGRVLDAARSYDRRAGG